MTSNGAEETFEGGCHCGAVRYRVTVRGRKGVVCNCSVCTKKGFLHLIVDESDFELLSGAEALDTYTFGTHAAKHYFCRTCGIHSFYRPRSNPDKVDVNIRCLEGVSSDQFEYDTFNGQHWEENIQALWASQRRQ